MLSGLLVRVTCTGALWHGWLIVRNLSLLRLAGIPLLSAWTELGIILQDLLTWNEILWIPAKQVEGAVDGEIVLILVPIRVLNVMDPEGRA